MRIMPMFFLLVVILTVVEVVLQEHPPMVDIISAAGITTLLAYLEDYFDQLRKNQIIK